jgi:PAS domain S-box-containing protein
VGAISGRRRSIRAPQLLVHAHPLGGRPGCWRTFAVLSRHPGTPTPHHQRVVSEVTHLASIAIAHKRNETTLRRNQQELRQVIDAIPQLIVAMSPAGQILYANESVLESTGLSLNEVMADGFREWLFHPDDLQKLRNDRPERMQRGIPFELEMRARLKDRQYRWFLVQYKPLIDGDGRVVRWYATGTDINDRKRAEEQTHNENLALREEISRASMFEEVVGSSDAVRNVLQQVAKVAPTDSTVLITGENGNGQRAHCACDSPALGTIDACVRHGELCGRPAVAHRVRAVRSRAGRVYRCAAAAAGQVRARRRWDHLSRRGRTSLISGGLSHNEVLARG